MVSGIVSNAADVIGMSVGVCGVCENVYVFGSGGVGEG